MLRTKEFCSTMRAFSSIAPKGVSTVLRVGILYTSSTNRNVWCIARPGCRPPLKSRVSTCQAPACSR